MSIYQDMYGFWYVTRVWDEDPWTCDPGTSSLPYYGVHLPEADVSPKKISSDRE